MAKLKITSWNIEHLDRLTAPQLNASNQKRRQGVIREIGELAPDILCVLEGPRSEAAIDLVTNNLLNGAYVAIKAPDGNYSTLGTQWIWFLVRTELAARASLLTTATWDAFTRRSWTVHYWGNFTEATHKHYRHPQVLVLDWNGLRIECIGLHLKSKFINEGQRLWSAGGRDRETFIREALEARVKMTTEALNVREYIEAKFRQVENPAIFVMGDLNDGPGKDFFEDRYLFFDVLSNIQGDVFCASRSLNHALFDYPDALRWTANFRDFVDPSRDPHILLDHIMFTQGLVDGSLPWKIEERAGFVEHEIHDLVNATLTATQKTSDHRPVSCNVTITP